MAHALFPEKLLTKGEGLKPTAEVLQGKEVIGIYFSAHWCGPCRGFTPRLAEWYENFRKNSPNADKLEIVFASSDRSDEAFQEYFKEMPWTALPFDQREAKDKLSSKFKVRGIPTLVFVDKDGQVLTTSGRAVVAEDPEGENYPWRPKPVLDILGEAKLVNNKGESFGRDALQGKYVGLYFSASWCPPCRAFSPVLIKAYEKLKADGKPFELIFCSSDRAESEFNDYFAKMPFLAIAFSDQKTTRTLSSRFGVSGIPTLVILDPEGNIVTSDGRSAISGDPEGAKFPWAPAALEELGEDNLGRINESPALIYLAEDAVAVERAMAVMQPIADAEKAAAKQAGRDQVFFLVGTFDGEAGSTLTSFAAIQEPFPRMLIMNIPEQCKHIAESAELSEANVKAFLDAFVAGSLKKERIR